MSVTQDRQKLKKWILNNLVEPISIHEIEWFDMLCSDCLTHLGYCNFKENTEKTKRLCDKCFRSKMKQGKIKQYRMLQGPVKK